MHSFFTNIIQSHLLVTTLTQFSFQIQYLLFTRRDDFLDVRWILFELYYFADEMAKSSLGLVVVFAVSWVRMGYLWRLARGVFEVCSAFELNIDYYL